MFYDDLDLNHPLMWTVDGILSPLECSAMIARIEAEEPEVATINAAGGPVLDENIRNNTRVMFDDHELAATLYERIRPHVPGTLSGMGPCGCNERMRCYKYEPGQKFGAHYDGIYERSDREWSLLTFMVYLNEDCEGGETAFFDLEKKVVPKTGSALLFQHRILHEGCAVTAGVKYALRTDVMYRLGD